MNLPGFLGFLKDKTANFPDPVIVKIGKKFSWNQKFTTVKRLQNPNLDWVKSLDASEDGIAMQIKHILLFYNFTNISVLEEILWRTVNWRNMYTKVRMITDILLRFNFKAN